MAEKKITYKLDIDTGDSEKVTKALNSDLVKTVKTFGNLELKMERLNNEFKNVKVGSKRFKELQKEIAGVSTELKNIELGMEGLDSEQVASELGSVVGGIGDMTAAIMIFGDAEDETMIAMQENLNKGIALSIGLKGAIESSMSAMKLWKVIQVQMNALMAANPIGLAVTAALALTAVIGGLAMAYKDATDEGVALHDIQEDITRGYHEEAVKAKTLFEELKNVNTKEDRRRDLIKKINKEYKEYLPNLLTEKSSLEQIEAALGAVNLAFIEKATLMAQDKALTAIMNDLMVKQRDIADGTIGVNRSVALQNQILTKGMYIATLKQADREKELNKLRGRWTKQNIFSVKQIIKVTDKSNKEYSETIKLFNSLIKAQENYNKVKSTTPVMSAEEKAQYKSDQDFILKTYEDNSKLLLLGRKERREKEKADHNKRIKDLQRDAKAAQQNNPTLVAGILKSIDREYAAWRDRKASIDKRIIAAEYDGELLVLDKKRKLYLDYYQKGIIDEIEYRDLKKAIGDKVDMTQLNKVAQKRKDAEAIEQIDDKILDNAEETADNIIQINKSAAKLEGILLKEKLNNLVKGTEEYNDTKRLLLANQMANELATFKESSAYMSAVTAEEKKERGEILLEIVKKYAAKTDKVEIESASLTYKKKLILLEAHLDTLEVNTIEYNNTMKTISKLNLENELAVLRETNAYKLLSLEKQLQLEEDIRNKYNNELLLSTEITTDEMIRIGMEATAAIIDSISRVMGALQEGQDIRNEQILQGIMDTNDAIFKAMDLRHSREKYELDKQLQDGLISQQTYEKNKSKLQYEQQKEKWRLDEESARREDVARKKAFEDKKRYEKNALWMNTASAVVGTWAGYAEMGVAGAIMAGIQTASILALAGVQSNNIDAREYGDGGLLQGPSHVSGGGIRLNNQEIGEGGEFIINKASTAKNINLLTAINDNPDASVNAPGIDYDRLANSLADVINDKQVVLTQNDLVNDENDRVLISESTTF